MTALLLALLACSGEPAPAPQGDGDAGGGGTGGGVDTADTGATCDTYGFGPEETWSLPALPGPGPWRQTSDSRCSGDTDQLYLLTELTGDGIADFVVFADCARASGVGDTHWLVYAGTGSGWAADPIEYALPAGPEPYSWVRQNDLRCHFDGDEQFTFADWNSDGVNDIVVFDDCDESTAVGASTVRVHVAGEAGFDTVGTEVTLPDRGLDDRWSVRPLEECQEGDATPLHAFADVDSDDIVDLVLASDCGRDPGLGTTHWTIVPGTATGFDLSDAYQFQLPDIGAENGFPGQSGGRCVTEQHVRYFMTDLDRDEELDIVVTSACSGGAEPGTTEWHWYAGSDAGWTGEPQVFTLPDLGRPGAWASPGAQSCSTGSPALTGMGEYDGDEHPELVMRADCGDAPEPGLGETHWVVWDIVPGGTLGEERRWTLPRDPEPQAWHQLHDDACGHDGDARFSVFDVTGDDVMDVVTTYACDADGPVGATEWRVRRGGCR